MRIVVALAVALFVAPTFASADSQEEPRDALAMSVTRISGKGVYMAWSPAPGGVVYNVYRGSDLHDLQHLGQTASTVFVDWAPPDEDLWYVVVSQAPQNSLGEVLKSMRGKCLATRGLTGVALTIANCMPAEGPM